MSEHWTEQEYRANLSEVNRLWGAEVGTPEGDVFALLCDKVHAYEEVHYPIKPMPSGLSKETIHAVINSARDCRDCEFSFEMDGVPRCAMLRSQMVAVHCWVQDWVNEDGTVKEGAPSCPCWSFVGERREKQERRQDGCRRRLVRPATTKDSPAMLEALQEVLDDPDPQTRSVASKDPGDPVDLVAEAKERWSGLAVGRAGLMSALLDALPDNDTPTPPMEGDDPPDSEGEVVSLFREPEIDDDQDNDQDDDQDDDVLHVSEEAFWNEMYGAIDHYMPVSTAMLPEPAHAGPSLWYHGTDEETAGVILRERLSEGSWLTPYLDAALDFGGPVVIAVIIEDAPHHGTGVQDDMFCWQWCTDARIVPSRFVWAHRYEQHTLHHNVDAARRLHALCALQEARKGLDEDGEAMWFCHTCSGHGCNEHTHLCDQIDGNPCVECEKGEMCPDCGGHGTLFQPPNDPQPPQGAVAIAKIDLVEDEEE